MRSAVARDYEGSSPFRRAKLCEGGHVAKLARHRTRNAEIVGSRPTVSSMCERLQRLVMRAARIRGSVAQAAAHSVGIREVEVSSTSRSSSSLRRA